MHPHNTVWHEFDNLKAKNSREITTKKIQLLNCISLDQPDLQKRVMWEYVKDIIYCQMETRKNPSPGCKPTTLRDPPKSDAVTTELLETMW